MGFSVTVVPKRPIRSIILILLVLIVSLQAHSYEGGSRETYLKVASVREPQPPEIIGDKLILVYHTETPVRFVGAAFAHEEYGKIHPFKLNEFGTFYLVYQITTEAEHLTYRLVVDGLWMSDPGNTRIVVDSMGISFSVIPLPTIPQDNAIVGPVVLEDRRVIFMLEAPVGERVSLMGSFNGWDPFMYPMEESSIEPGLYRTVLRLTRGTHYYRFLVKGTPMADPRNVDVVIDGGGREASVVIVP